MGTHARYRPEQLEALYSPVVRPDGCPVWLVACPHKPRQTYTRWPCSCGRPLWPPRGRGKGEAISSPRRLKAYLRACDAIELRFQGATYQQIADALGYADRTAAWHAVCDTLSRVEGRRMRPPGPMPKWYIAMLSRQPQPQSQRRQKRQRARR